jgi:FkbM family methyltransferase
MSIKYKLGSLLRGIGYRVARDYKWPQVHGNLLLLGCSLLHSTRNTSIQIVQVGAFDGHMSDPLEELLQHDKTEAVLVEPQKDPCEALVKRYAGNRRIRVVNAAIAESDGSVTLFVPSSEASQQASLIAGHHKRFGLRNSDIRQITVPSLSVASLVKQCGFERVDILQLDTEGMDYRILRWFLQAGMKPHLVNFESLHLSREERLGSRDLLRQNGYWWVDTEQDTFAVKETLVRDVLRQ